MFYVAVGLIIVTVVAFVLSPKAGVVTALLAKPVIDATFDQPYLFGLPPTQVISTLMPLFVFGYMVLGASDESRVSRMPLFRIWLGWTAYAAIFSALIAFNSGLLDGANIFFRHANGLAGFYAVQAWFRDPRDRKLFFVVLAVAGVFPMATGLYEGLTGYHWHEVIGEGDALRNVGMYHDAIAIRVYALQTLLALLLLATEQFGAGVSFRILASVYAAVCLFVIYKALTKSGTLIAGAWAVLWPLLRRTRHAPIATAVVFGLAMLYLSSDLADSTKWVFQKEIAVVTGSGSITNTFAGRWVIWFDWLDEWSALSSVQRIFGAGAIATGLHSDYLMIMTHGGIVGFSLYLLLLTSISWQVAANVLARPTPLNAAAVLMLIMWVVDSIGLVPSAYSEYQWFVWGVVGLAIRTDATVVAPVVHALAKTTRSAAPFSVIP